MRLDQHINADQTGKYSLILERKVARLVNQKKNSARVALKKLKDLGVLQPVGVGDFFVIKTTDIFAPVALRAYAAAALDHASKLQDTNPKLAAELAEYGKDILGLMERSMAAKRDYPS